MFGVPNLEAEELGSDLSLVGSYNSYDSGSFNQVRGVTISGNYAYVSNGFNGMWILNIEEGLS